MLVRRLAMVGACIAGGAGLAVAAPIAASAGASVHAQTKHHVAHVIEPCPLKSIFQPTGIVISLGCYTLLTIPDA